MSGRRSVPPAPLADEKLAQVFEARVVPGYWARFAGPLQAAVASRLAPNARILELGCATGALTVELSRLAPQGRVMAIEPCRPLLEIARKRAADLAGRRIFFKSEPLERTTFADAAFDAVVANLPFEGVANARSTLTEMRRVVTPRGFVAMTLGLAGTWSVVLDVYQEVVDRFEFPGAAERIAQLLATYPKLDEAVSGVKSAGFDEVSCEEISFPLRFRNARELFRDDLVLAGPLAAWRAVAGDEAAWERAVFHMRETMDTYFAAAEAIEVVIRGAVLMAESG